MYFGILQVFLRYSSGIPQVFLRYSPGIPQVFLGIPQLFLRHYLSMCGCLGLFLSYSLGIPQIFLRYSSSIPQVSQVFLRQSLGSPEVFLRYSLSIAQVFLRYSQVFLTLLLIEVRTDVDTCLANSPPLNALPVPLLKQVFPEANRTAQACVLETFWGNQDLRCGFVFCTGLGVALGCLLGAFWRAFWVPWAHLGTLWGPFGLPLGPLGAFSSTFPYFWMPLVILEYLFGICVSIGCLWGDLGSFQENS